MTQDEAELAARVQEALARAGLGCYALKVRCQGRTVRLQGIVDVLAEKLAAGDIAGRVPGAAAIENDITVCTDGPIDDGDVAAEVAEELAIDPDGLPVGAAIRGGRVRLRGKVATAAAAADAVIAASMARGVREVTSEIKLADGAARDDPSLVNAVRERLSASLGNEARGIRIHARRGLIALRGEVRDAALAERARETAAQVPGVREVRSELDPAPDPRTRVIREARRRAREDCYLRQARLAFSIHDGRLVVEGRLGTRQAKRALERLLFDLRNAHRAKINGLDNRTVYTEAGEDKE